MIPGNANERNRDESGEALFAGLFSRLECSLCYEHFHVRGDTREIGFIKCSWCGAKLELVYRPDGVFSDPSS